MQTDLQSVRILAFDLRTGRFGFAILEGPHELLEWGTRRFRPNSQHDPMLFIRKRLAPLFKFYGPAVVVVKRGSLQGGGRSLNQELLLNALADMARSSAIELAIIERSEIQAAFSKEGRATKETIAQQIAATFPQLTWKLPARRKAWSNEAHMMTVFDAVSLGLTYLSRSGNGARGFPPST
jgi:hypothetical protein